MSDPQSITTHGGVEEFYGAQSGAGGEQGFYGVAPVERQTVSGVTSDNEALGNLLTALEALGLITDSTTTS